MDPFLRFFICFSVLFLIIFAIGFEIDHQVPNFTVTCLIIYISFTCLVIIILCIRDLNNCCEKKRKRTTEIRKQKKINKKNREQPVCVICDENIQCTRLPCGHANMCYLCADKVKKKFGNCPICFQKIEEIQNEFFTEREYVPPEQELQEFENIEKVDLEKNETTEGI